MRSKRRKKEDKSHYYLHRSYKIEISALFVEINEIKIPDRRIFLDEKLSKIHLEITLTPITT